MFKNISKYSKIHLLIQNVSVCVMKCTSNACAPNVGQSINKISKVQPKYYRKWKSPKLVKYFSRIFTVHSASPFVNLGFLTVISANI